jgi:PAS domain S-box-containing protein
MSSYFSDRTLDEIKATIVATNPLPPARTVTFEELRGGALDSQWIAVEGIVHAVRVEEGRLHVRIGAPVEYAATVAGRWTNAPAEALELPDAKVRLRCVCSTRLTEAGSLVDFDLLIPGLDAIEILEPATKDLTKLPLESIASCLRYDNAKRFGHRVRFKGVVTAKVNDTDFLIQDDTAGAYVTARQPMEFRPGDVLEVAALPEPGYGAPGMEDGLVTKLGRTELPPPIHVNAAERPKAGYDSMRVSVEGRCLDAFRSDRPPKVVMKSGDRIWQAFLEMPGHGVPGGVRSGAVLAFTGTCSVEEDDAKNINGMHIWVRSPEDIRVVVSAPWWTVRRALAVGAALAMGLLAWGVVGLRREVHLRERYRLVFENSSDLVSTHDASGRFTAANPAWEKIIGIPAASINGTPLGALVAEESKPAWRAWWKVVAAGGQAPRHETELISGGGGVWVELSARRDPDPRSGAAVECIGRDITLRRRTERFLAGQRRALEKIAGDAPLREALAEIVRTTEEQCRGALGMVLPVNPETGRFGGCVAPGLPAAVRKLAESAAPARRGPAFARAAASGAPVYAAEFADDADWGRLGPELTALGVRSCWSAPVVAADGGVIGVFTLFHGEAREPGSAEAPVIDAACAVARIAIGRNLADEALRRVTSLQRAVLDSTGAAIFSADGNGTVLTFNRSAERLLGYAEGDVAGRVSIAEFHDSVELERHAASISAELGRAVQPGVEALEAKARAGGVDEREWTYVTKDGRRVPVLASVSALSDGHGEFSGILVLAEDLTMRKKEEDLRLQLENQLRQSQKLQAIGTLAGGIAHDFNNILSVILGNAELLQLDLPPNAAFHDSLSAIVRASGRGRGLVRQILSFSRPGAPERQVLQLKALVVEALGLIRSTLPTSIEINAALASTPLRVRVNPTQVHQVLMNLCTNASHAIGSRPGRIDITLDVVPVAPASKGATSPPPGDRWLRLTVADDGCGIEASRLERIFEPFFTTKEPGEGAGLGLSVVHGIMDSHGGSVTVQSDPGRGATFNLYFPAVVGVEDPAPPSHDGLQMGRGERVLVVDDEPSLSHSMLRLLDRLNYRTTAMTDPIEALQSFEAAPEAWDAVVTDLTMPQMRGDALAGRILGLRPDFPVIVICGRRTEEEAEELRRIGVFETLDKPVSAGSLARVLHEALVAAAAARRVGV